MVPAAGVEPARPRGHEILSLARLPIPSRRQECVPYYMGKRADLQVVFLRAVSKDFQFFKNRLNLFARLGVFCMKGLFKLVRI